MGDYFGHWLKIATMTAPEKLPKIFFVNWFRKDGRGKFAWPGYGENSRVLKWICQRLDGKAEAQTTPIGLTPTKDALDLDGLTISDEHLDLLLNIDLDVWFEELALVPQNYDRFGAHLPAELWAQHRALAERLHKARRGAFRVIKGEGGPAKPKPNAGLAAS
jgi:phosphoenolpyruvate carboxykinase (GTP)